MAMVSRDSDVMVLGGVRSLPMTEGRSDNTYPV